MKCNASVVLYNTGLNDLTNLVSSFELCKNLHKIYFVDNSPTAELSEMLRKLAKNLDFEYIHLKENPGFGAAHNVALRKSLSEGLNYHAIVNPDISFSDDIIDPMVDFMDQNPDVGMMMPQILNEDGSIQNLPKLLPSPLSVFMRKFKKPSSYYEKFINNYELRFVKKDLIYNAPILSGCFTLLRMSAVKEVGMYDDKFFMYFEDWDLSRRMHQKYQTVYFPKVSIIHGYESGANKNKRLFKIFVNSAITYFNKWGWIFDSGRKKINKEALSQFK